MPCAIVIGAAPVVQYTGPQKLAIDMDEMGVAGALAGEPIRTVKCITVDLDVPADSELVIEGFIDPELLAIGESTLRQWIKADPRLSLYEHYVDDLFRKQAHVRSAEVEELLGMVRDPFGTVRSTASMLANADFQFKAARDSAGPWRRSLAARLPRPRARGLRGLPRRSAQWPVHRLEGRRRMPRLSCANGVRAKPP